MLQVHAPLQSTIPPIDFDRLAQLRLEACAERVGPQPQIDPDVVSWRSRSGDMVLWESTAPAGPTYVPPCAGNVIIVSQARARRIVTWLPVDGVRVRPVEVGDVTIVPAGEPMYVEVEGPHRAIILMLRPRAFCPNVASGARAAQMPMILRPTTGLQDAVIQGMASVMLASVKQDGGRGNAVFLDSTANALVTHLHGRYMKAPDRPSLNTGRADLTMVIDMMAQDLHERLSLADLAAATGYSTYHFNRLFKTATGMSPQRYRQKLRMLRARELVETTRFSLIEIGAMVGLDNPAHFSRAFRAFWQVPPSQLRR